MCLFYWGFPEPSSPPEWKWELRPIETAEANKSESDFERGYKAGFEAAQRAVRMIHRDEID